MSRVDDALARARREADTPGPMIDTTEPEALPLNMGLRDDDVANRQSSAEPTHVRTLAWAQAVEQSTEVDPRGLLARVDPSARPKLVIGSAPAPTVEQYRRLAATLHKAQETRNIKTLAIVSAVPSEGKTLTAANLALTLSESYRRDVLLIDADLRRPSVDQLFQLERGAGLLEGLKAPQQRQVAVRRVSQFLSVLPAGFPDPDPMEALASDRMRQLIHEAARSFDWVIIDTPPVALLPDANLMASLADAALLVVRAGGTPLSMVRRAIDAVGKDRILGTILNATEGPQQDHGHYAYSVRHGKPVRS